MAGKRPLLKIGSDVAEAIRGIDQVKDKAETLGRLREEAKVSIAADAALAKLDVLKARLERYGAQEQTARVKIATGRAVEEIDRIEAKLDKLGKKDVTVSVRIREAALSRLSGAGSRVGGSGLTGFAGTAIGGATSVIGGIAGAAGQGAGALAGLLPVVGEGGAAIASLGVSAAVAAPLVAALGFVLVALTAAAIAVVASLAAAAAAVVGLGVAFGAALIPIAALAIPAIATITKLFGALKTNAQGQKAAAEGVKTAQQGVAQATQAVTNAQQNLASQAVPALQAMQDAAERVKDAILGVKDAQLGVQDASLAFRQAKFALAQFRAEAGLTSTTFDNVFKKFTDVSFRPTASGIKDAIGAAGGSLDTGQELQLEQLILAVKHARLGQQQATDKVHDSTVELSRAQQANNTYLQQGIRAYPGYQSAVQGVTSAEQARTRALDALVKAQDAQHKGTLKLTAADQARLPALQAIVSTFTKAFNPAVNALIGGIFKGAQAFASVFTDPKLSNALSNLGGALGDVFVKIGEEFQKPAWREAFVFFSASAARLARILGGDAFVSFLNIIRKLATAFMPMLLTVARDLAGWLRHIADASPHEYARVARSLWQSFVDWFGVAKSLVRLLGAFFPDAKRTGDGIARALSRIVDRWTAWLNAHPGAIKAFFSTVLTSAKALKTVLDAIVSALKYIAKVKNQVIGSAISGKVDPGKFINQIQPVHIPVPKTVGGPQLAAAISDLRDKPHGLSHDRARATLKAIFEQIYGHVRGAALFAAGHYSTGGLVPGAGGGDTVPAWLQPGEFVMRKAVVQAIGLPALSRLNAAPAMAGAGGHGGSLHQENHFHITTPDGGSPDGRYLGQQIIRDLGKLGLA
jgi:hypothetical protein